MAAVISVPQDGQIPMGSGLKMVKGTIVIGTYATGGVALNLSNYLLSTDVPFISFSGGDNISSIGFFLPSHDGGTVAAGKVRMVESGASTAGLREVNNSLALAAVNIGFCAIGRGF